MVNNNDIVIEKLSKIEAAVKRCKDEYSDQTRMLISDLFKNFFEHVPTIKTVEWTQALVTILDDDEKEVHTFALGPVRYNALEFKTDPEFDTDDSVLCGSFFNKETEENYVFQACLVLADIMQELADGFLKHLGDDVVCYATKNGIHVENL